MKSKKKSSNIFNNLEYSKFSKKLRLFKETKWISFGTYIMTVEGFNYNEGSQIYIPILNTFEYQSDTYIVRLSYDEESYFIKNKELYKNVNIGDKIVITIKYYYGKNDNLIYYNIHHYHPYPLSNN